MGLAIDGWQAYDHPLAAHSADQAATFEGLLWMAVLLLLIFVTAVILSHVRRRILGRAAGSESPFTLQELRRMRDRGELTIAEYETLRKKTVQVVLNTTEREA